MPKTDPVVLGADCRAGRPASATRRTSWIRAGRLANRHQPRLVKARTEGSMCTSHQHQLLPVNGVQNRDLRGFAEPNLYGQSSA
jgi:hypothetical protein